MANITVTIPNVGDVEFPDTMSQGEIESAVSDLYQSSQNQTKSIDYSIPTDETFIPAPSIPKQERTISDRAKGVGETVLSTITGIPAYAYGTAKGVGTEILTGDFGKGTAEKIAEETAGEYTYQPRTEAGQEYLKNLGKFVQETGIEGVAPNIAPTRVIPSVTGRTITQVKPKDIPTIKQLKEQSTRLYDEAKNAGVEFKTPKFNAQMSVIERSLREEGYTPKAFPKLDAALTEAKSSKMPRDFTELQALRKMLNNAKASADPSEQRLASIALDKFDEYIMKASKDDVKVGDTKSLNAWQDARDTYTRLKKSEVFEEMLEVADIDKTRLTQSGLENALAQQLRNLAKNKKKMRLFTKQEQEAIIKASKGDFSQNTLRFIGKFAPTGVFTGAGLGALAVSQPAIGIPLAAITMAGKYGATKARKTGIENLSEMMRQPTGYGVRLNKSLPTGSQYYFPSGLLMESLKEDEESLL